MGKDHQTSLYGLPSQTQRERIAVVAVQDSASALALRPQAAYVHIPFCRRRCFYCDFPIQVTGDRRHGGNFAPIAAYLATLAQEIQTTPILANPKTRPLQTVFFGGGTPSLLLPEQIAAILEQLRDRFGLGPDLECSIEVDPGTFSLAQIQGYQAAGVNRFSLGVQAFQDELLAACGRFHRLADIEAAVQALGEAGVENWSLDLISGLPHQTLDHWQDSLQRAIALAPTHLSVYDLTLEAPTVFGKRYQPGQTPLPSDETTAQFYRTAQQRLTSAGYDHYEVSNYAKPGFYCRHNLVYWRNQSYYGFGLGAASYLNGHRFSRPRYSQAYQQWVQTLTNSLLEADPMPWILPPDVDLERLKLDRFLETLMLGLRLRAGVNLMELEQEFGAEWVERLRGSLAGAIDRGWAVLTPESLEPTGAVKDPDRGDQTDRPNMADRPKTPDRASNLTYLVNPEHLKALPQSVPPLRLRLSDPEGFLFSNQVISDLFAQFLEDSR